MKNAELPLILNIFERFFRSVSILILAFLFIVAFLQVLTRYALHISIPWTEELARLMNVWLTYMGVAYLHTHNGHIKAEILVKLLKINRNEKIYRYYNIIREIIVLGLSILGLYGSWRAFQNATTNVLASIPSVSYVVFYAPMVISFVLIIDPSSHHL